MIETANAEAVSLPGHDLDYRLGTTGCLTINSDVTGETTMMLMTTSLMRDAGALICLLGLMAAVSADEWGTVSGRIQVRGTVPSSQVLDITRDEEFCGQFRLKDQSVQVNDQNKGLANAVIWLYTKDEIPVHPSRKDISQPVVMDNLNCVFKPRMVPLRANQMLHVTNSDPVPHNVSVYARRNLPVNLQVPDDEPLKKSFVKAELLPVRVDCSTHAWMRAYLIITDHGCVAVTDDDGRFEIPNVPYGDWEFRMWHERPGYLNEITIDGTPRELKRGTLNVSVNADSIDLGEIQVAAEAFLEE